MSESVTTTLGAGGACPEIELDGKTWKIGHPTLKAKGELEQLAVDAAFAEIEGNEGKWPAKRYKRALDNLEAEVKARQYRTWGEGWQRIVWGPMTSQLFLLSLLRENHPEATEADAMALMARKSQRVGAALAMVTPDFVDLLLKERTIPPEQREAINRAVTKAMQPLLGTQSPQPPEPTNENTAMSSRNGRRRSAKNRGVSTPTK